MIQAAIGSASLLFCAQPVSATHGHRHAHEHLARRHGHGHYHQHAVEPVNASSVKKRGTCSLPTHPDIIPVPGAMNNGFAIPGDRECSDGSYCPYACVPGKVMAQWQPNSKYVYPESMVSGVRQEPYGMWDADGDHRTVG